MDVAENKTNTVDTKINETEKKGLDKTIAELMKKLKQLLRGMSQFTIFGSSFTQQLSQLEQQVEENGETTEEVAEAVAGVNNTLAVIGTKLSENDKADKETQIALNEMKEQLTELANQLSTVNEIRAQAKDIILDPNVGRDYNFATIQNEDGSKNFVLYNMYPSTNNVPSYYEFAVKSTEADIENNKPSVLEFEVVAEREFSLADLTRMNELREQGRLEDNNELVNVFNETDDLEIRMNAFDRTIDEVSNLFKAQAREIEKEFNSKNSGESYNYTPDAPIQFHQTSQSGSRDVEGSVTVETETNDSKETVKEEQEEEKDDYERDF